MPDETTLSTLRGWVRLSAVTGAFWSWLKNWIGQNECDDWVDCEQDQISMQELYRTRSSSASAAEWSCMASRQCAWLFLQPGLLASGVGHSCQKSAGGLFFLAP